MLLVSSKYIRLRKYFITSLIRYVQIYDKIQQAQEILTLANYPQQLLFITSMPLSPRRSLDPDLIEENTYPSFAKSFPHSIT